MRTDEREAVLAPSRTGRAPARIQIREVRPQVEGRRYPVKATVGDRVDVGATIFRDGHEVLGAAVRYRGPGERRWREAPLESLPNDRWAGTFEVERPGRWQFNVEAWVDRLASWRREVRSEGRRRPGRPEQRAARRRASVRRPPPVHRGRARRAPTRIDTSGPRCRARCRSTSTARSHGSAPGTSCSRAPGAASAAWSACCRSFAELGFDVVYLPPIHPIGETNRKGRNNTPGRRARRPRQPVGDRRQRRRAHGGAPRARNARGLRAVGRARARGRASRSASTSRSSARPTIHGCSEHPEWFHRRPDGTLKYAENPPKRYQDIYNVNFDSEDWQGLWAALLDVVRLLGRARRAGLPRRQPAHEAAAVLGVADRRGARAASRDDLPVRGVHASGDDDGARARRASRSRTRTSRGRTRKDELVEFVSSSARGRRSTGRTCSPTRRTSSTRTCSTAGRPLSRPAWCSRRRCRRHTASTPGSSPSRTCRCARAARSTWTRRSTRRRSAGWTARCCRSSVGSTRCGARVPAFQRFDNLGWLETENDTLLAYAKRTGDDVMLVAVNLDPFSGQEGLAILPGCARATRRPSVHGKC